MFCRPATSTPLHWDHAGRSRGAASAAVRVCPARSDSGVAGGQVSRFGGYELAPEHGRGSGTGRIPGLLPRTTSTRASASTGPFSQYSMLHQQFTLPLQWQNSAGFSVLSRAGEYTCLCILIAIIGYRRFRDPQGPIWCRWTGPLTLLPAGRLAHYKDGTKGAGKVVYGPFVNPLAFDDRDSTRPERPGLREDSMGTSEFDYWATIHWTARVPGHQRRSPSRPGMGSRSESGARRWCGHTRTRSDRDPHQPVRIARHGLHHLHELLLRRPRVHLHRHAELCNRRLRLARRLCPGPALSP